MEEVKKQRRGFAAMDPAKQLAIAKKGGAAVPNEKRTFSINKELAITAGRLGGKIGSKKGFGKKRHV
jgi:general stress protein YciG